MTGEHFVAPPLCPPFFLLWGYPSSAKLVVGRPTSTIPYLRNAALSTPFHSYGNVSVRQHGRRTPLPYEMRSPGYPATYDLRGTQREGPAESPQEGGRPSTSFALLGYPRSRKNGGHSEVKRSRAGSPHGEPRTESPSEAGPQYELRAAGVPPQ